MTGDRTATPWDERIAALRETFRARCAAELAQVREQRAGAVTADFGMRVHRLAGMAGSIGFEALGDVAADMDDTLATGGAISATQLRRLEAALIAVVAEAKSSRP